MVKGLGVPHQVVLVALGALETGGKGLEVNCAQALQVGLDGAIDNCGLLALLDGLAVVERAEEGVLVVVVLVDAAHVEVAVENCVGKVGVGGEIRGEVVVVVEFGVTRPEELSIRGE